MSQHAKFLLFVIVYTFVVGHFNFFVAMVAGCAMLLSYMTFGGVLRKRVNDSETNRVVSFSK